MMGLMLHTNAKQLITGQNYQDALEVLSMGEVSYWCLFATDSFVFFLISLVTWLLHACYSSYEHVSVGSKCSSSRKFPVTKNVA